ncbi:MAG: TatD family hydrolase [Coriobacteriales bacterium]|nr:TatD family hydrolase [Coriobacteriales bacterium]
MAEDRQRMPEFGAKPAERVELPALGAETADTHAHLDMLDDPVGALRNAAAADVTFVATVVDLTEKPEVTLDDLGGWLDAAGAGAPEVGLIVGVHPHNARHWSPLLEERLRAIVASDDRVIGLGELGLDYHYEHSSREDQRAMFARQLELAHEFGLPVTVHLREAHDEGLGILDDAGVPTAGAIIHCFTEDAETAERFLALGDNVYVSFAGPVTFKKAEQIRDAARVVPLDRLLSETDCPFLAPAPYRGRPNEPAYVTLNVAAIARARGDAPAEVAAATLANARRIFGRS